MCLRQRLCEVSRFAQINSSVSRVSHLTVCRRLEKGRLMADARDRRPPNPGAGGEYHHMTLYESQEKTKESH